MISTSDFKNGMTILYEGQLYRILYFQHVKPGKGGAFVRTKLKDLNSGAIIDKTFRAGEKMEQAILETRKMQYLYKDEHYHFMDIETYEQIHLSEELLEEQKDYLIENMELFVVFYKGKPISIELPITIESKVIETEPGVKGDTVSSSFKPAVIETGAKIMVPLFIDTGDIIKVDTRTGEYITRVGAK
ncbi:MAG: elongation factor P [Actinomycetota bacterium]|nr:elongation factor P [Actinomycetota bacterium]